MNKIKIRHEQYMDVDDVEIYVNYHGIRCGWMKNGAVYYHHNGWSEVPEPEVEDVTGEVEILPSGKLSFKPGPGTTWNLILPCDHSWHKTTMYALPFGWKESLIELSKDPLKLQVWLDQFAQPAITIHRRKA